MVNIVVVIIIVIRQITLNRPTVYSSQTSYLSCYHNQLTSPSNQPASINQGGEMALLLLHAVSITLAGNA